MNFYAALLLLASNSATESCAVDASKFLDLPFDQFDQDLSGGWRKLKQDGCIEQAAEILSEYRSNRHDLNDGQRSALLWHEGQLYAFLGKVDRAVPLMLAAVPPNDDGSFSEYAIGSVAFLRRDKHGLIRARNRLSSMKRPSDWPDFIETTFEGKKVQVSTPWPPNLNSLNGLIRCFDIPYSRAYFCRPLKIFRK